ncbi:DNA primase, partial [Burkholderia cenocepacia]|nr:DNA primase [Burkholderia cenocepacia]
EGLIKAMTGGDPIPARGLWSKTTIEVVPTWVAFMPTNHKPIVKGDDHAIWRRLMLVPFERNFDKDATIKKDPSRAERLAAELPGVLAWCVRGALAYQQHGLRPTSSVAAAR